MSRYGTKYCVCHQGSLYFVGLTLGIGTVLCPSVVPDCLYISCDWGILCSWADCNWIVTGVDLSCQTSPLEADVIGDTWRDILYALLNKDTEEFLLIPLRRASVLTYGMNLTWKFVMEWLHINTGPNRLKSLDWIVLPTVCLGSTNN